MKKRMKLFVAYLKSQGFCESQGDLGRKLGIKNQNYFSQVCSIDEKIIKILPRLKALYPLLNEDYILGLSETMLLPELPSENEPKIDYYGIVTDVFTELRYPNWIQFAKSIGWKNAQLYYDLKAGKCKKIPMDFVTTVVAKHPNINADYLLGKSDKILRLLDPTTNNTLVNQVNKLNSVKEPNADYSVTRIVDQTTMENPIGVKEGKLFAVDMETLGKVTLRDYYAMHQDNENVCVCSLIPDFTFAYQIRTKLLEPFILQWDWVCLHYVDKSTLVNGHVYLVDSAENGRMVKRLEITDDTYILSLPVSRKDYPTIKVPKSEQLDFYDIVCRISTYVGNIFSEQVADQHYMALAAVEANKELILNERIASENVKVAQSNTEKALQLIDKLTDNIK